MGADIQKKLKEVLDDQLFKSMKHTLNKLTDVFISSFSNVDFSRIQATAFYGSVAEDILLRLDWHKRGVGSGIVVSPDLTDYEASILSYLSNRLEEDKVVSTILALIETIENQPQNMDHKHIDFLSQWVKEKGYTGVEKQKDKDSTRVLKMFLARPNPIFKSVPKNWEVKDLVSYILATGDLPNQSQAQKLSISKRKNSSLEERS